MRHVLAGISRASTPQIDERRFIEVKGRAIDADTVMITCNEVMAAPWNEPERWVLVSSW
ncbi:MAG: DUF3883 domain-containing protein [Geminicoccaceae bacterium]